MHGDGTKLGTTTHNPPSARLLDLTRLMRRSGKVLTGVDRVEFAYLRALIQDEVPVFGLIRSRLGYILLDQNGLRDLMPALSGPAPQDKTDAVRRRTLQHARRLAIGRVLPPWLGWMLRRKLPVGVTYLNVGHSNLSARVMRTLARLNVRIAVLIHDVIPLDFPEFQRDGAVARFASMMARVGGQADLVIFNSEDTRTKAERHWPNPPPSIVAHLGTDIATPTPDALDKTMLPAAPFFVCVGTIEPRKNHGFLLDIWEVMGPDAPGLVICGGRGWKNEDVFERLDALPRDGKIVELEGLSDGALAALVTQSAGVLFPSLAEGFGLPATEAAARGVPIIVNDLAVFREILGDIPVYACVSDRYLWMNGITKLVAEWPNTSKLKRFEPPTWGAHFKTVLTLI